MIIFPSLPAAADVVVVVAAAGTAEGADFLFLPRLAGVPLPCGRIGLARETFFVADDGGAVATLLTPAPAAAAASSAPAPASAPAAAAPAAGHALTAALGAVCCGACPAPGDIGGGWTLSTGGGRLSAGAGASPVGAALPARANFSYDGGRTMVGRGMPVVSGPAAALCDCRGGVGAVVDGG